jgi:hypothetical protein
MFRRTAWATESDEHILPQWRHFHSLLGSRWSAALGRRSKSPFSRNRIAARIVRETFAGRCGSSWPYERLMNMAPQPLSTLRTHNHFFGSSALVLRAEQAARIAVAISGWAATEAHLGHLFAALLGAESPLSMEVYAVTRSFDVQRDMIETALRDRLPTQYSDIGFAILTLLHRTATTRHHFAHWIWGSSPDIPDAVLLAEPKMFWRTRVARLRHWKKAKDTDPLTSLQTEPQIDRSAVLVYKTRDLDEVINRIELSYQYVEALYQIVVSKTARRRQIYLQLLREHDIRAALEKRMKAQNRSYKLPRK